MTDPQEPTKTMDTQQADDETAAQQTDSMASLAGDGGEDRVPPGVLSTGPPDCPAIPSETAPAMEKLAARVDDLARLLEESNRLSAERERIIDRLHQENQNLRLGELYQAQAPLFHDLVRLFDDLAQTANVYAGQSASTTERVARDLECYRESVADILYRQGIERYEAAVGMPFDGKQHRALAAVATADVTLDRTIARVIRVGFKTDTRIIRPLEAEVYRCSAKRESQPDDEASRAAEPNANLGGQHGS